MSSIFHGEVTKNKASLSVEICIVIFDIVIRQAGFKLEADSETFRLCKKSTKKVKDSNLTWRLFGVHFIQCYDSLFSTTFGSKWTTNLHCTQTLFGLNSLTILARSIRIFCEIYDHSLIQIEAKMVQNSFNDSSKYFQLLIVKKKNCNSPFFIFTFTKSPSDLQNSTIVVGNGCEVKTFISGTIEQ